LEKDDFVIFERHRHRREINPKYHGILTENGMEFHGIHRALDGTILVEIATIKEKPWLATQFHPEFNSNYATPSPFFYWFVDEAIKYWNTRKLQIKK
jgi:CTP synthase